MSNQFFGGFTCSDVMRGKAVFDMAVAYALRNLNGVNQIKESFDGEVPVPIIRAMELVENRGWVSDYGNLGLSLAHGHCILTIAGQMAKDGRSLYADVLSYLQPVKIHRNFSLWTADPMNENNVTALDLPKYGGVRMAFSDGSFYFAEHRNYHNEKHVFAFDEAWSDYLCKKVLPDCDEDVMVCASDLGELVKIESPVLDDPEYRALIVKRHYMLRRVDFNKLPKFTDDEYLAILRARKDMDSQILTACSQDKKNIRSHVIAEYILDRLGGISKTRLDDLLGKISVSITTKQNIRNRFKILLGMYPNCLLSQTQLCNPQHVEAVRNALRDGFQQEGLL